MKSVIMIWVREFFQLGCGKLFQQGKLFDDGVLSMLYALDFELHDAKLL